MFWESSEDDNIIEGTLTIDGAIDDNGEIINPPRGIKIVTLEEITLDNKLKGFL